MSSVRRRELLKGAAATVLALTVSPRLVAANDEIRVAVIGFRSQGRSHIRAYRNLPGVRIVALCDVDEEILAREATALEKNGGSVKRCRDLRRIFDDGEIDAVSIVTPNHWHALASIWACQAGKDVCVEKPVSHSIWEGRKMVEAARRYGRMVQADLDNRSRAPYDEAFSFLRKGGLGKILYARALDYKRRDSIGRLIGPQAIPTGVDYNLWTGPAPMGPLMRTHLHYDWHWQWATGNGEIGNNGPHQLDLVRWALGKDRLPTSVLSFGGRYGYIDDGQVPNTLISVYDYEGIPLVYECRGLPRAKGAEFMDDFVGVTATGTHIRHEHKSGAPYDAIALFCEQGYFHQGVLYDNDGKEIRRFDAPPLPGPQENFIQAVRSRRIEDLKTDVLQGHLSTAICHMGNISYMIGEPMSFDAAAERVAGNAHSERAFAAMKLHLTANGLDLNESQIVVGPELEMDSTKECFVGSHSERANLLLKDTYREPFVIRDAGVAS